MLLAIEQGNTNTLFAIHDGNEWTAQWRSSTESSRTADEYAVWLMQLVHLQGLTLDSFKALCPNRSSIFATSAAAISRSSPW
jgi:type III pantothenate kinase